MKLDTIYLAGLAFFVGLVIVLTFAFPFRSLRVEALDSTMSSALSEVSEAVKTYAEEKNNLPKDLTELDFDENYSVVNNNPGILNKITYNVNKDSGYSKTFTLCADFKTEKKDSSPSSSYSSYLSSSNSSYSSVDYQTHPKGYHCFDEEKVSSYEDDYRKLYENYLESTDDSQSSSEDTYYN